MSNAIRIYVADLAAYNAGHLHGVWVDATQEFDEIHLKIAEMLEASPVLGAEEYAIHDFDGFEGYQPGEYASLEMVHQTACFIEENPELGGALLAYFNDLQAARQAMDEGYQGCFASLADYAQDLTEQAMEVPQHLAAYIDYQAMACDLEYGGEVFTVETGYEQVHVFTTR